MAVARFVVVQANGTETEHAGSVPEGTDARTFGEEFFSDVIDAAGAKIRVWVDVDFVGPIEELGPPHAEVYG